MHQYEIRLNYEHIYSHMDDEQKATKMRQKVGGKKPQILLSRTRERQMNEAFEKYAELAHHRGVWQCMVKLLMKT